MKRRNLLAMILSLVMCLGIAMSAWAAEADSVDESQKAAIIDVLQYVESDKGSFNLSYVDFKDIEIGKAIRAYEYTDNGFMEIKKLYPLFYHSKIIALSTTVDGQYYQITTALARDIAESSLDSLAIVYDAENCYLYDGVDFILIADKLPTVEGRALLFNARNMIDTNQIILTDVFPAGKLGYFSPAQTRATSYYACDVSYITQRPYDYLCWAACMANVVNCLQDSNYNTVTMTTKCLGEFADVGIKQSKIKEYLQNKFGIKYDIVDTAPSDNTILKCIKAGNPIIGGFFVGSPSNLGHAAIIFAVNPVAGYITIMDSNFGSVSTSRDWSQDTYSYYSDYSGNTLTLGSAILKDA